ncbi:nuclear transport factor 2 family protein [Hyphococcus lacteus]|uniref:Nuclear transport factor 2 family protein n=1 Tax=Hyphococcus lacteus TaxID=3143536 RepID=A0ABV3Z075_9PROT
MSIHYDAILRVLKNYYDGLYQCDTQLLETVFHPDAHYHTTSGGEHLCYDMPDYMALIKTRIPPANAGDTYDYSISNISIAGDDTAVATLKCTMMGKHFTDFLSLIRTQNGWQIIAKVFHYDLKDE